MLVGADGYWYLGTPYTHPDDDVMEARYQEAMRIEAALLNMDIIVHSPIVENHPVAVKYGLPRDFAFWERKDTILIRQSIGVLIAQMDGWLDSKGISFEEMLAKKFEKPLRYLDPANLNIKENK